MITPRPLAVRHRFKIIARTAALAAVFVVGQAGAQADRAHTDRPPAEQPPAETGVSPIVVSEQFSMAQIGVTVFLPVGCSIETESQPGGRVTATIGPGEAFDGPTGWLMRVYNLATADETLTPTEVVDQFITRQTNTLSRRNVRLRVLKRYDQSTDRPLQLGEAGLPAARFYSTSEPTDGFLSGYTIVRAAPGRFLVFQLVSAAVVGDGGTPRLNYTEGLPHFGNESVALYETVAASLVYEDPALARLEDARRLRAGAELLDEVTTDDIRRLIEANPDPQFLRIYEPADNGLPADANEIAFQKVTLSVGQLGEIEPERSRGSWTPKQREYGYIVSVDAKMQERGVTAETRARYFLSLDREEEFWVTTTLQSRGNARSTAREVVIRRGDRLSVTITESAQPEFVRDWPLQRIDDKRFYISRVEQYLLPYIIADKFGEAATDIDFAFYAYDSGLRRLTRRTDAFSNRDIDGWLYDSARSPEQAPFEAVLNRAGELITRELGGGRVMERSSRERLRALWQER